MSKNDQKSNINNDKNVQKNSSIQHDENIVNDRKRKNSNNFQSNTMSKQLKNNYYAILDNDKECNQECLQLFEKHVQGTEIPTTSKNVSTNISTNKENNTNEENVTNNKHNNNKKIPPINIFDVEPNELIKFIKNGLKINEFKIKELYNKKLSLFMFNINDYNRVKAYLQKTNVKFFTYTPKETKTKTYLLKGLSANIDPNEIFEELCKFQNPNLKFIKVSQFKTKRAESNSYDLPIYLVQISGESKVNELKSINGLLYRCVRWEALRKPEITQCRNCQSFFHSASNCYLPPRCVKCDKMHEIGKCTLDTVPVNEREKLFCVLCNKYGHPASYKGCEKYKELQQKLRAKKQTLHQKRTNNPTIDVNTNISYANIVKNNNSLNLNNNNPIQVALEQLNNSMQNLSNQIINLQKHLQIQTSRIDTIYSMLEV